MKLEEIYKQIQTALNQKDWQKVKILLKKNGKGMGQAMVFFYKGEIKLKTQNFEAAIQEFDRCLNLGQYPEALSSKAVALLHLNRKRESLQLMRLAAEMEPNNPYRHSSLAYILERNGQLDEAIAAYERCIELDPMDAVAHNNLGLLIQKKGFKDKAQIHFQQAERLMVNEKGELKSELKGDQSAAKKKATAKVIEEKELVEEQKRRPSQTAIKKPTFWGTLKSLFQSSTERRRFGEFLRGKGERKNK